MANSNLIDRLIMRRLKAENATAKQKIALMQQVLETSDSFVIYFDFNTNMVTNVHGTMLPTEGMTIGTFIERIHPEERDAFETYFKTLRNTSEALKRGQTYRWDMTGAGKYANLYGRVIVEKSRHKTQNIICAMTDITDELEQEAQDRETAVKYTSIFDKSMVGLALYNPEGQLLNANNYMRKMLKYEGDKDEFWYSRNLYVLLYSDTGLTPEEIDDRSYCTLCDRPERNVHEYLELHICPIRNDAGTLMHILVSARKITGERDLYLQQRASNEKIRAVSRATAKYEENLRFLLENAETHIWRSAISTNTISFYKSLHVQEKTITTDEFIDCTTDEDARQTATLFIAPEEDNGKKKVQPTTVALRMVNLIDEDDTPHVYSINRIPQYDSRGVFTGYFGLLRDISALCDAQEKLRQETARAADSEQQKSAFLANMSHEIRTPLNAIVGFSDILPSIDDHDERMELIRIIHKNSDLLIHLINDILVISTMDANGPTIIPRRVDFAKAFDDLCQTLELQVIDSPGVTFIKDNPYKELIIEVDIDRIQQIIINFVTNAVKFTKQGHIKVGYRRQTEGIYIYCEDTGRGIPEEKLQDVFKRFVKLNAFVQGTGLGLNICKAIVDKCGGEIGVESALDKGSTFHAYIPCPIIS